MKTKKKDSKKIIRELTEEVSRVVTKPNPCAIYFSLVKSYPLTKIETVAQNRRALKVLERLIDFTNQNEALIKKEDKKQIYAYMAVLGEMISQFEKLHYPSI